MPFLRVLGARATGCLTRRAKDDWLSAVLLEWGRCGTDAVRRRRGGGFALYAPPEYVDGTPGFGAAPVSDDAVLLMTAGSCPSSPRPASAGC